MLEKFKPALIDYIGIDTNFSIYCIKLLCTFCCIFYFLL